MIRRVCVKILKLLWIVRRTIFGNPELGDLELLVAQHVQQRDLAYHGAKELRALRERSAHQKAAVAAALNGEMSSVSIFFRNQMFGGANKVVKNILLFIQHAGAMPVF